MYTGNHEQILEKIATLNETLSKMIAAADKDADVDPKVLDIRCKTIKQMIMEVDNSLGDLHDILDTMQEYDEENWPKGVKLVDELESNTQKLVEYLRSIGKY